MVHVAASMLRIFDGHQSRSGLSPSMLFDRVSSDEIFPYKKMGDAMSRRPVDTRRLAMHSFPRWFQAGKTISYSHSTRNHIFILFQSVTLVWMYYYTILSMLLVPSVIFAVSNGLIFSHVRASSRRVQTASVPHEGQQQPKINQRDLSLLRHMIIMFCITLSGRAPVPVYQVIGHSRGFNMSILQTLLVWYELALLANIVDLFLYNHELRKYLVDLWFTYWPKCRKNENIPPEHCCTVLMSFLSFRMMNKHESALYR